MPRLCLALTALFAAGAVTAQDPDSPIRHPLPPQTPVFGQDDVAQLPAGGQALGQKMPSLRTPIHSMAADLGIAYGTWAAGDTYKVSFHDGMTFVPYLGSGYPHNQPLSWRTSSARIGAVELVETSRATPSCSDFRCEYDLGSIVEVYDVRADGLEQSFVLTHNPAAAGDLVIRGAITSALRTQDAAPAHQKLTFIDADGHAIVEYGVAQAFDAAGNRIDVLTGVRGSEITLTVPGAWLAKAAFPVTVDPVLTRVQVASWGTSGTGQPETVDIGRDDNATSMNILVAYTRSASATDDDLWGRLVNEDYSGTTQVFTDITTSWSTDWARCAYVGGSNKWVMVFRRHFPQTTVLSQIRCHVHASGDTTLSTAYGSMAPPSQQNDWRPDVGGVDAFAVGNNALVVFQREDNAPTTGNFSNTGTSSVYGSLLDTTTTNGTFGSAFVIDSGSNFDCERPSVNQVAEGGSSFSWIVADQRYDNGITNDDWDVLCRRVDNTGSVTTSIWFSPLATTSPATHQLGPVVEGQNGRYAVIFATADTTVINFKTGLITGYALYTERFDWANGAATYSASKPPVFLRSNTTRIWEATGIAADTNDDSHWAIGFRAVSPGSPTAYFGKIGYHGSPTEGPVGTVLYSTSGHTTTEVACTFNNDSNIFHYAYGVDDGTATQPIYGQTLEYNTVTGASTSGSSCSSETLSWIGNQQVGAEFNRLQYSGAPATAVHVPLLSLASIDVPVIHPAVSAGCRLLISTGSGYLGQLPLTIGASGSYTIPLPETLSSFTFYIQDWYLNPSTNLFQSSVRLTIPVVK